MKKVLLIIVIILGLWLLLFTTDYILYKNDHKPFIVLKTDKKEYQDGYVITYTGLGYKVIEYNRETIKKFIFLPIFKQVKNEFKIIDETGEVCNKGTEYFYEDDNFKYYFFCKRNVFIEFDDGLKVSIDKALASQMITIDQLKEKNLEFGKENKYAIELEIEADKTCSYYESDPSKLVKKSDSLYYYCIRSANIYVNKNYSSFEQAFEKKINIKNLVYDMNKETEYESGAILYSNSNYRILVCSNNKVILGTNQMEYFDIFCK